MVAFTYTVALLHDSRKPGEPSSFEEAYAEKEWRDAKSVLKAFFL